MTGRGRNLYARLLRRFGKDLSHFPDGRIDYSSSRQAPVVTVFIEYGGKILLLKRSRKVRTYKGKWNTVAGYLDEDKPLRRKVLEEVSEEIGLAKKDVRRVFFGKPFTFKDTEGNLTWHIFPALIQLKRKPRIRLDFEHTAYRWIDPKDIYKYKTVKDLPMSLSKVF